MVFGPSAERVAPCLESRPTLSRRCGTRTCGLCAAAEVAATTGLPVSRIHLAELRIQRPVVVDDSDEEQAAGQQIEDAGNPLAHVEPMDAEDAEERQQHPRDVVVLRPRSEAPIGRA